MNTRRESLSAALASLVLALLALAAPALAQEPAAPSPPEPAIHATGLATLPAAEAAKIEAAEMPLGGPLPARVDMSDRFPPPGEQGDLQSCVAWAVAYAVKSFQENTEEQWGYGPPGQLDHRKVFSPSFIYNQINQGLNQPTYIEDALRIVSRDGAALWAAMPYTLDPRARPSNSAFVNATRYRIASFQRLVTTDTAMIRAHLARGNPVVFGMRIDSSFDQWAGGGVWRPQGGDIGGHAMTIVGYDDGRGAYKVINSWGRDWGDGGYVWIAYDAFAARATSAYVLFDGPNEGGSDTLTEFYNTSNTAPEVESDYSPAFQLVEASTLTINSLQFNIDVEGFYDTAGYHEPQSGIRIPGLLDVPAGVRGNIEIVATVRDLNGRKVRARFPGYADPNGRFTASTVIAVNGNGLSGRRWSITLPVCALDVASGSICVDGEDIYQTDLLLNVSYFLDGQVIATSPDIPFWVGL